jgi:pyruvate/2-oxoglutarate dehydrogenase complex dihydrolipoamide acyltransferase (E2) component
MIVQQNPVAAQFQRAANDIAARLAQLAKEPPDLLAYFRVHAECLSTTLRPAGFAYEMQNGQLFQRLLHSNLESLNYRGMPEQEGAFLRAIKLAAARKNPVRIGPHTLPSAGLHGLSAEDAPAPEELPIFNRTAYEQVFVPILLGQSVVGVLHIWFEPGAADFSKARVALLQKVCAEVELYLKARRLSDISQEVTRLTSYSRLLENLSGDLDLDSVGWNIVNFARETIACDRVCLFVATNYEQPFPGAATEQVLEHEFELHACSGLKTLNPRSEQAVILRRVARRLTQNSLVPLELKSQRTPPPDTAAESADAGPSPATPETESAAPAPTVPLTEEAAGKAEAITPAAPQKPAPRKTEGGRPTVRLTLINRASAEKSSNTSEEVLEYFEVMPMNWATVLPLFDRNNRVCGIFLFEGVKPAENLVATFPRMLDLGTSAGRALGTALYWDRQKSIRLAQRYVRAKRAYIDTPAKKKFLKFVLPFIILAILLLIPMDYTLKGDATLLPVNQVTLPTLVNSRLISVKVREGETVKQGQVLAELDTRDLRLQLRQVEQDYERALLESQSAMSLRDEFRMHAARINSEKSRAVADKLRLDIERSTLRAPIDGIVLGAQTLATRLGEVLRTGEPILDVIDPSVWQVKVSMREQDLIYLGDTLSEKGPVPVTLALAANPARRYELEVKSENQIAFGLDTARGKYDFSVMLPLETTLSDSSLLKSGFGGRAKFSTGLKPAFYVLFRDFVNFLRVRFL